MTYSLAVVVVVVTVDRVDPPFFFLLEFGVSSGVRPSIFLGSTKRKKKEEAITNRRSVLRTVRTDPGNETVSNCTTAVA